jgi:tRNA(Ser,Leu) C12 N-acetylase TAN1
MGFFSDCTKEDGNNRSTVLFYVFSGPNGSLRSTLVREDDQSALALGISWTVIENWVATQINSRRSLSEISSSVNMLCKTASGKGATFPSRCIIK